jgi:nucleotide-binding universal stress UspA family protein
MPLGTVLVHADAGPGSNRRVRLAAQVAALFDADILGLGAEALETVLMSGNAMIDGAVIEAVREQVATELPAAEKHFRQLCAGAKSLGWISEEGYPDQMLALHARGADLVVTSRPTREESAAFSPRLAPLVMNAGAPILIMSDRDIPFSARRVVVGWKDTRESRRALSDALPFLIRAEKTVVVAVSGEANGGATEAGLAEIAERLKRHGVAVATEIVPSGGRMVVEALEDAATRHGADLIVAGAYARSRMREWLLGGVTEDLIAASSKYVLLSH